MKWKSAAQRKARLYLDDEWWMTVEREVLEALQLERGIEQGMELSDEERASVEKRVTQEKAKMFVLRSLSARPQTRAELERKLLEREYPEEASKRALDLAEEYGFIDDAEVAGAHARSLKERGYWLGRARLKLRQKGVERDLADQILAENFDREDELEAAGNALKGKRVTREPKEIKRSIDFLLRRGFTYAAASGAVRELLAENEEAELLDEGAAGASL
jgi:regulatory protein